MHNSLSPLFHHRRTLSQLNHHCLTTKPRKFVVVAPHFSLNHHRRCSSLSQHLTPWLFIVAAMLVSPLFIISVASSLLSLTPQTSSLLSMISIIWFWCEWLNYWFMMPMIIWLYDWDVWLCFYMFYDILMWMENCLKLVKHVRKYTNLGGINSKIYFELISNYFSI